MILVAGGTGTLGTRLVTRLASRNLSVRIFARDTDMRRHAGPHVETMRGDVRDRASVAHAVEGAEIVVSAVQGFAGHGDVSPASVDRDGNANLIDAAARAGATVVLMSIVGAASDSPMELFRMKHAAEQHLRTTAISWTIIRPTAYLETWIELLEHTAARSGRPSVFGRGDNPINFVSANDVAALVERVVTDRSSGGEAIEIGGPQDLTLSQLATAIQSARGRSQAPRHVPRTALRLMSSALRPLKPDLARQARAALVMDAADLTFDDAAFRAAYPDIPRTTLVDLLTDPASADL